MSDKYSRVCALINLNNIYDNMVEICSKIGTGTDVYAVIKADGYGHGAVMLAKEYEKIEKSELPFSEEEYRAAPAGR